MGQKERLEDGQKTRNGEAQHAEKKADKAAKEAQRHLANTKERKNSGQDPRFVKRSARRALVESEIAEKAADKARELSNTSDDAVKTAKQISDATGQEVDKEFTDAIRDLADETKKSADNAGVSAREARKSGDEAKKIAELSPAEENEARQMVNQQDKKAGI